MAHELVDAAELKVMEGIEFAGRVNCADDILIEQIQQSIRRGLPQVHPCPERYDRVVLLGAGPSLNDSVTAIRDLLYDGAKLVTTNGAYHWALEHNFRPSAQIVLDARQSNVRFVQPRIPNCAYYLASQCHPDVFDAVGDQQVAIFHAVDPEGLVKDVLDAFYLGHWHGITGGTTVVMRGLCLLRTLGYLRFDLFGVDSCFVNGQHHAMDQPENESDKTVLVDAHPAGHPEMRRRFVCAPWMLKQLEDLLQIIKVNGEHFLLNIHGDGLLAYAMQNFADLVYTTEPQGS